MNITQCLINDLGSIESAIKYAERIAQAQGPLAYQYECAARFLRAEQERKETRRIRP